MKNFIYTALLFCCVVSLSFAQTTILDFEAPATSTVFQYFGSPLDGSVNTVIANPNATGANTSSKVSRFVKPAVAEVWAGAFSNPNPTTAVDLTTNGKVKIKVHMDHVGVVMLKFEGSTNGGANWEQTVTNTKVNQWEELTFDATLPGLAAPNTPAKGFIYARVVVFFDFGTVGTGTEVVSYFDDIVAIPGASAPVTTKILDFEAPATTSDFQYFGSALDGTKTTVIANPNATGVNTSSKVTEYKKPAVSEVWAGAFASPDPTTPVDFTSGGQICADVHMDHIGSLSIKLEGSTSGKPNWITKVPNTKVNQWETLCFDASAPSLEAPFEAASGTYTKVVIFYDFGTAGTGTEVTSYLDNIVVKSSSAPVARTVKFNIDLNSYAPNFDKVFVAGTFNNWSIDANELSDPNMDGIYTGSVSVPNGSYEYKVLVKSGAVETWEQLPSTAECVKVDPSGAFINRLLLVSADVDLPKTCFASCYACGEEVKMTFRLGMNGVAPSADGVWIAGGGNFDVPGGRYKMKPLANNVFELVVPRKRGFKSFFVFTNGACPDYSCKEQLMGLPCSVPTNFNDRFIPDVTKDTIYATCFGTCFNNVACVSGTDAPVSDAGLFQLLGNPVQNDAAMLQFGNDISAEKLVQVTNTVGQVIHTISVQSGDTQLSLPLEKIPSGIYFVTVRAENRYFTRRFVK
jgi:Secretion system C-terminal sorting domain/Carbohydrate-binding module 48 (Isoamylase N-terminal domain)